MDADQDQKDHDNSGHHETLRAAWLLSGTYKKAPDPHKLKAIMQTSNITKSGAPAAILWAMLLIFAGARVLQVYRLGLPMMAVVVLHVIPPAAFALIHGAAVYRLRGILIFTGFCLGVGSLSEIMGVATGFPFGHYYFTDVMGPKFFNVPVFLALAYLGMGYLSWVLGGLILGCARGRLAGSQVFTLPLAASFIMLAWDLAMDPIWATVVRAWIWKDGGPYFGVPVSNFFGWYLTVYVFYQLFALYLRGAKAIKGRLPRSYWRLAVLFYAICAVGNLVFLIPRYGASMVTDPAGVSWKLSDIAAVCALISVFVMCAFALLAWAKTDGGEQTGGTPAKPLDVSQPF
jgi:putative membrane protein